jgi:hypothetical protein
MEIRGDEGVALTPDGRFEWVPVGPGARVGQEIAVPRRRLWGSSVHPASRRKAGVGAIAAALILGVLSAFLLEAVRARETAVAYVEVDINPAVELGVNRFSRVVSVEPLDEEGGRIVEGLDLESAPVEEAVESLADAAEEKGFIAPGSGENTVLITVTPAPGASLHPDLEQKVESARSAVSKRLEAKNAQGTVQVILAAPEVREQAKSMNIPPGRLAIMLKAKEKGVDIEAKPPGEIEEVIRGAKEEKDWPRLIEKFGEDIRKELKQRREHPAGGGPPGEAGQAGKDQREVEPEPEDEGREKDKEERGGAGRPDDDRKGDEDGRGRTDERTPKPRAGEPRKTGQPGRSSGGGRGTSARTAWQRVRQALFGGRMGGADPLERRASGK